MASYMRPFHYVLLDPGQLPLNRIAKIDYVRLSEMARTGCSYEDALADAQPITIRDVPLAVEGFTVALRWHARVDGDPGLAWLRRILRDVAPR